MRQATNHVARARARGMATRGGVAFMALVAVVALLGVFVYAGGPVGRVEAPGHAQDMHAASSTGPGVAGAVYAHDASTLIRAQRGVAPARPAIDGRDPPVAIQVSREAALQGARQGGMDVSLPDGTAFRVAFERDERAPGGNWTYIGRVDTVHGPLAAVLTFGPAGAFGVLPTPDGRMLHLTTSAGQSWLQPAGGIVPPGGDPSAPRDFRIPGKDPGAMAPPGEGAVNLPPHHGSWAAAHPHAPVAAAQPLAPSRSIAPLASASAPAQASQAGPVTLSLLGVYTTNLVALRGSVAAAETEFTNLVAVTNQAHIDSGSKIRVQLAGLVETDYPADLFNGDALDAITANQLPDGLDVFAARDAAQADLVAMLRPYATDDYSCGIAWVGGGGLSATQADPGYGYSVSAVDPCGPLVLPHELGHNMGSMHDIETSSSNGYTQYGAYKYSFGYRQDGPPAFATVMAYSTGMQSWIGRFSQPGTTLCLGGACGIDGEADNVRSLNRMADRLARFRDPPGTLAVLDTQAIESPRGDVALSFQVRLSTPAPAGGVTFDIGTTGGSALAGSDYQPRQSKGMIPEGNLSYVFEVAVLDDGEVEAEESVTVGLANVVGAQVVDAEAIGYIVDDDPRVQVSGRVRFPAGSTPPSEVSLWIEAAGEAYEYWDLVASAPDYTYAVDVQRGATVTVNGWLPEPYLVNPVTMPDVQAPTVLDIDVVLGVQLEGALRWDRNGVPGPVDVIAWNFRGDGWGAVLPVRGPDYQYRVLVLPGVPIALETRDAPAPYVNQRVELPPLHEDAVENIRMRKVPGIAIPHLRIPEGAAADGAPTWSIPIRLSGPAPAGGVSFDLQLVAGSAEANDYQAVSTTLSFAEGTDRLSAAVRIQGDDRREPDEAIHLHAANIQGAAWTVGPGSVVIQDDDGYQVPSDFDGDGRSDVLWRNAANGRNGIWLHASYADQQPIMNISKLEWSMDGVGDFDGDGRADIFWRNHATGANAIWRSGEYLAQLPVGGVTNQDWQVVAVGDFDGNGRSDLFWRNLRTGANAVWKGGDKASQASVAGVADTGWQVAAVGDFNGDGRDDVFWRHDLRGANTIWSAADHKARLPVANVAVVAWQVAGVGDIDADDLDDVIWRHAGNGKNVAWLSAEARRQLDLGQVASQAWQVEAVGDYDGDALADLLWRNRDTGANQVWRGADRRSSIVLTRITNPDWEVRP